MGRLGLGVPEALLAGPGKAALERHCSPAKLTGTALEKPLVAPLRIPFWASLRTPVGTPLSGVYICWVGLLPGESRPELELEPGLWPAGGAGPGVSGSRPVPGWQRGARQEWVSWNGRRRCNRAGFVPETGRPRFRSCCRNSDTWGRGRGGHTNDEDSLSPRFIRQ